MSDDLALLVGMLQIPSLSGEEARLAQFLVAEMQARGFRSEIDAAGNAVGRKGQGSRQVVLLGHMDTVPGLIPVEVKKERIFGRGAVDAKGPLAAFIAAAAGIEPPRDKEIVVIGAVEEEAASSKGARYALGGYRPEAVIIGEPSGWSSITLGYKGRLLVEYRLAQDARHASAREPSAGEKAIDFWNELSRYAQGVNRGGEGHFHALEVNLRGMGLSGDGLREEAFFEVGLRVPPGMELASLEGKVRGLAQSEAELRFFGPEEPFLAEKDNALVRAFTRSIRREGARPTFKLKTGTSDMNVVGPVWRCPIVAYGPGDSSLDHTPQEHLELAEYQRAIAILARVLSEL